MILAFAVGVSGCVTSGSRILGHRGTRGEYQENCAEAVSLALGRGITGFEAYIRDKAIADNAGVDFVCVLSGETTPADLKAYTGTPPSIVVDTFDRVER